MAGMLEGYVEQDEQSIAVGLLGLAAGLVVGEAAGLTKGKNRQLKQGAAAATGLAVALGVRAAFDPTLVDKRKTA